MAPSSACQLGTQQQPRPQTKPVMMAAAGHLLMRTLQVCLYSQPQRRRVAEPCGDGVPSSPDSDIQGAWGWWTEGVLSALPRRSRGGRRQAGLGDTGPPMSPLLAEGVLVASRGGRGRGDQGGGWSQDQLWWARCCGKEDESHSGIDSVWRQQSPGCTRRHNCRDWGGGGFGPLEEITGPRALGPRPSQRRPGLPGCWCWCQSRWRDREQKEPGRPRVFPSLLPVWAWEAAGVPAQGP